jgi:hypothetical protein
MWFWKNNGPRPPISNEEAMLAFAVVCIVIAVCVIVQNGLLAIYQGIELLDGVRF